MPNWCHNTVDIHGEYEELKRFALACEISQPDSDGKLISFNHLFPIPEELQNTVAGFLGDKAEQKELQDKQKANIEKYGHQDWYEWANTNWGSKWGACQVEFTNEDGLSVGDTYLGVRYESAWSPADGLICKISELFPSLLFSVVSTEESDAFVCYSIFSNGKLVAEDGETPEIPKEIIELQESNEDSFYDKLADWQTEYFDLWNSKADEEVHKALSVK